MLEKQLCYKARSDITALSVLKDNTIAFSTKVHGAKIFSLQSCSSIKNLSIEFLGYKTTAVAFHQEEDLLAIANHHIIYIISTKDKMLLQTIKTNVGIIEIIYFVPKTKYIITGTNNGRVIQYRYDGRAQLSRLCSFGQNSSHHNVKNNYVSVFAFHETLFACSGYGGVITILKMHSYMHRYSINASKVRINALCFLDKNRIVSGNVDGLVQIHSLKKYQVVKNITTPFKNIKHILLMTNPNFIMVSGEDNRLLLIDITLAKVISNSYLSFKENVSMIMLNGTDELLVILQSKEIFKIKLPNSDDLKIHLFNNDIDKAYELIERDPMLKGTREHKRVEVMYDKMYSQAIDALIQSNAKEARNFMKMFSDIPSKKDEVSSIFKAFEFYPRFKTLCLEKKYSLAYAMAEKHPALKHTQQFKKIEETFKENFSFAQKQIVLGRADVAKEILHPYMTSISKKPMINLVLHQNENFINFLKAINDKDYLTISKLTKKNSLFCEVPSFIALQKSLHKSLETIQEFIDKGEVHAAIENIKTLINVPDIQNELRELYQECQLVKRLQDAYAKNDFVTCYEILDSSQTIDSLELSQFLEKHWTKLMNECEIAALQGDIKSIKNILKDLIKVKTRIDKIGDLLRVSFQIKIKTLIAKKSFKNTENIIYSYIDIFGLDSEIRALMKVYEKVSNNQLAITLIKDNHVKRDAWLHSSLIMDY